MSRQYDAEELLRLRASPLVCKPVGLLPTEEWMGPLQEVNQRRPPNSRGKPEDPLSNDTTTNRRALFEARSTPRGSSTLPEDIVLGPPKTAFASAAGARNGNKLLDPPNRTNFGLVDDETMKNDRVNSKERLNRDGNKPIKDGDKPRDTRLGNLHHRKGTKEDNEPWSGARQQKGFSHDDAERGSRRNGDWDKEREKDGVRDPRPQRGFENHRRDGEREGSGDVSTRRNMPGKGRFEPSWYRDEDHQDGEPQEGGKDINKPRDWRDKDKGVVRGADREWNKAAKPEQDPEWMDEPESEEKKQTHTQEDFQRWKERMKASNGPSQDTPALPAEQRPNHERTVSNMSLNTGKGKVETPLIVDPNFDGFFGLWSESNKETWKQGIQEQPSHQATKSNVPKSSKFTGFFSPKPVPETAEIEPSLPKVPPAETIRDSSNEDKEGFQRILKLLDQQQPSAGRNGVPIREKPSRDAPTSQSIQPPRSRESSGVEQHTKEGTIPQSRDSEFLLKLMQQTQQARPNLNPNSSNHQRPEAHTPGIIPFSSLILSSRDSNQQASGANPPLGFINDSTRNDLQHRDRLNPTTPSERKGLPPGFFGGFNPEILQRPVTGVVNQPSLVSTLQRPPGLEQTPSTFVPNIQPQRQGMVPPPPGFQAPLRAHNPFPPGLMPNLPNSNNPSDRGTPYGLRSIGPSGPTGMPPPGFMTINPPPPGFPLSPPFNQDDRMTPPGGRVYYGPAGTQRQAMEGFGEPAGFGIGILPGQYRRQE